VGKLKSTDKPFAISKWEIWEAWNKVKANDGAPGVDGCTVEEFEADLKGNLYKIWNRMSSGSYFPPPVLAVEIPKPHSNGTRVLGVPTVADRVAQTVVARRLEAACEPVFHPDSYGYRPGRGALEAVKVCRQRCWRYDWVVDLDIQKFFDSVPWDLLVKAVQAHSDQPWVVLYVKRWLAAPLQHQNGTVTTRDRGTPQGSAVSPVLANLFLHYAFDAWMQKRYPKVPFERYVDDAVVHCASKAQALMIKQALTERMRQVGLTLHPDKTQVVYCKDTNRRGSHEHESFVFLGFEFRQRQARNKDGRKFSSFVPAISTGALRKLSRQVRTWRLQWKTGHSLAGLARVINPIVRGWMNYYGAFYRSALDRLLRRINAYLVLWLQKKYKRLRSKRRALQWFDKLTEQSRLFAHWEWTRKTSLDV
jgi:RNA-directed DNA polymerase